MGGGGRGGLSKQYTGKKDLWDSIMAASKDISSDKINKLTSSTMDQRLFSLISNTGGYISINYLMEAH